MAISESISTISEHKFDFTIFVDAGYQHPTIRSREMQSTYHQLHFDEIRVVLGALRLLAFHVGSLRWREKSSSEKGEKETTTNFLVALEWKTMKYRVLKLL